MLFLGTPAFAAAQESRSYHADFEAPAYVPGSIHGQQGWAVDQGRAEVAAGTGLSGSAGLVLIPSSPFSQARLSLQIGAPVGDVSFVDLFIRPIAGEGTAREEIIDVDSARIGLFRTDVPDRAALWIFHGDGLGGGIWMATPLRLFIDAQTGQSLNWHRLTIREDSKHQSWDLWLDGAWACAGAGFQEPRPAGAATCIFMGDRIEPLALDELRIGSANPLGPDADRDGLLDDLEKSLGSNPGAHDREGDADGNGISNLDQAISLLSPAQHKPLHPVAVVPVSLSVSQPSALLDGPVEVSISLTGKAAAVRFTLDGTDPAATASGASIFPAQDGKPITISRSAVLRVAAMGAAGEILGRTSAAYLFPAETARFARPEGFPNQLFQGTTSVALHYGSPVVGQTTLDGTAVREAP